MIEVPPLPEHIKLEDLEVARKEASRGGDWYTRAKAWLHIAGITNDPKDLGKAWNAAHLLHKKDRLKRVEILVELYSIDVDKKYLADARAALVCKMGRGKKACALALIAKASRLMEDMKMARKAASDVNDEYYRAKAWFIIYEAERDPTDLKQAFDAQKMIKRYKLKARARITEFAVKVLVPVK